MPLRSFPNLKLVMSRYRKELRGALGHGLCVNSPLIETTNFSDTERNSRQKKLNEIEYMSRSH